MREAALPEGFHLQGLLFVHESLRSGLSMLEAAAPAAARLPLRDRETFRRWFELFWRMVEGHHRAEDALIFPCLHEASGQEPPMLATLQAQHRTLHALHTRALRAVGSDTPEGAADLSPALAELSRALRAHLEEEEGPLVALIAERMSREAQSSLAERVRRALPGWRNALLFPWVVERLKEQPANGSTLPKIPLVWRWLQGDAWRAAPEPVNRSRSPLRGG